MGPNPSWPKTNPTWNPKPLIYKPALGSFGIWRPTEISLSSAEATTQGILTYFSGCRKRTVGLGGDVVRREAADFGRERKRRGAIERR
jgi:hypothetical protein